MRTPGPAGYAASPNTNDGEEEEAMTSSLLGGLSGTPSSAPDGSPGATAYNSSSVMLKVEFLSRSASDRVNDLVDSAAKTLLAISDDAGQQEQAFSSVAHSLCHQLGRKDGWQSIVGRGFFFSVCFLPQSYVHLRVGAFHVVLYQSPLAPGLTVALPRNMPRPQPEAAAWSTRLRDWEFLQCEGYGRSSARVKQLAVGHTATAVEGNPSWPPAKISSFLRNGLNADCGGGWHVVTTWGLSKVSVVHRQCFLNLRVVSQDGRELLVVAFRDWISPESISGNGSLLSAAPFLHSSCACLEGCFNSCSKSGGGSSSSRSDAAADGSGSGGGSSGGGGGGGSGSDAVLRGAISSSLDPNLRGAVDICRAAPLFAVAHGGSGGPGTHDPTNHSGRSTNDISHSDLAYVLTRHSCCCVPSESWLVVGKLRNAEGSMACHTATDCVVQRQVTQFRGVKLDEVYWPSAACALFELIIAIMTLLLALACVVYAAFYCVPYEHRRHHGERSGTMISSLVSLHWQLVVSVAASLVLACFAYPIAKQACCSPSVDRQRRLVQVIAGHGLDQPLSVGEAAQLRPQPLCIFLFLVVPLVWLCVYTIVTPPPKHGHVQVS